MKSLPTTSPGLPKAAQWAALHECAHSEGCGLCREATSVSSLRNAARTRCLGVSSADWAGAAESGCGGRLSRTGAGQLSGYVMRQALYMTE